MSFEERQKIGAGFEDMCISYIESHGVDVARLGIEFKTDLLKIVEFNNSDGGLFFRFMPDLIAKKGGENDSEIFLFEAKNTSKKAIEKNAYNVYSRLDNIVPVYVLFKVKTDVYCGRVSDIKFLDSHDVVNRYSNPFPVDDDGWIAPNRQLRNGSGTSYRVIDLNSLAKLNDWGER